eukprot:12795609-Heterocapsa_arctica.AAC.1
MIRASGRACKRVARGSAIIHQVPSKQAIIWSSDGPSAGEEARRARNLSSRAHMCERSELV